MHINYLAVFLVSGAMGAGFAVGVAAIIGVGNVISGMIDRFAD